MENKKLFQKEITVLIILYKEKYEMISGCLKNLKNFKVIIIDNDNNIDLKKKVCDNFDIYKYILNKKNVGFASGAAQGVLECTTSHMLFLTADCYLPEEGISLLYEAKKKYSNTLITSPTFYDQNHNLTYNGGPLPENGFKDHPLKLEGDACVEAVITTAILFEIDEIKKIGSIDKNFFIYFQDDELSRRIRVQKKAIIQVFNSKAIHNHGTLKIDSKLKAIFVRNFHFTYDELYYYFKNRTHLKIFKKLKKKSFKYFFKIFFNLLIFRVHKSTYYLAKTLALLKFMVKFKQF